MFADKAQLDTPGDDQTLWRYMDFSKYVDLVTTSELYFARADKLPDPYDCSGMQFFGESYKQLVMAHPYGRERTQQVNTFQRLFVYVNCWHMSDVESAALWRLYSENRSETIALRTTFGKLAAALHGKWPRDRIRMAKVRYDPENAGTPCGFGKLYSPEGWEAFVWKRPSFAHERELRAFIFQGADKRRENDILRNEEHLKRLLKERPEGIRVKIALTELTDKVFVSPHAAGWFVELVKQVSGDLKDRVVKSDLYTLY